ncbi:MAG: hypothetical protein K2N34_06380, partial [Lachnospiraceae bacterium]|nr:hypothetical protein [Lachnospiraceae bacterium]
GLKHPKERGHNVKILFACRLNEVFKIDNGSKREDEAGYLKWFDKVPENILQVHDAYKDILTEWERKEK